MRVSPHFTLEEMTVTSRRDVDDIDGDGDRTERIPNVPTPEHLIALRHLCDHVLEPIRARLGVPLFISSGYRSAAVNDAIGGARKSQHLRGEAVDFVPRGVSAAGVMTQIAGWLKAHTLTADQVILYPKARTPFIHISYTRDRANRNQLLVSDAPGGSGGPYRPWTPTEDT